MSETVTVVANTLQTIEVSTPGPTGPSGVVSVTAPITNSGTSTSANIGINQSALSIATTQLTGTVSNAQLANSSVTVNGSSVALGGSITISAMPYWQAPWTSGSYVTTPAVTNAASMTGSINTIGFSPFFVPTSTAFKAITVYVITAQASTTIRLGIYNANAQFQPTSLVLDAGTVDSSTVGAKTITISQTLPAGNYCLAAVSQGGTTQPSVYGATSNLIQIAASTPVYTSIMGYNQTSVTGALPTTATPSAAYTPTTCFLAAVRLQVN